MNLHIFFRCSGLFGQKLIYTNSEGTIKFHKFSLQAFSVGKPMITVGFPMQRDSNIENVSMSFKSSMNLHIFFLNQIQSC